MYDNADAETLAERELVYEEAFRSVGIDFKKLKKLFWEDDGPPSSSSRFYCGDTMSAWNDERAFHGYSANTGTDYLCMRVNTSNGKLHQILELLPSSESASELPSNEKEPDGDLAEERVFAGPEFAQWRLRVQNLKERVKLRAGCTLKQFVSSMEPDEAKCYVLDTDDDDVAVGGSDTKPDVAVGGKPKYDSEVEFGQIQGLYWTVVDREELPFSNKLTGTSLLDTLLKQGEAIRSALYESYDEESYESWLSSFDYARVHAAEVAATIPLIIPCDWRELGLKVALYDLLAEDFFSDPIGRQNIVPEQRYKKTERFNLRLRNKMQYRAVVLSFEAVVASLENAILIDGENYRLFGFEDGLRAILVFLNEQNIWCWLAWSLWTLVHLQYPLAEVVDTYSIRWNSHEIREGLFIRTAGLVNIPGRSSRVIVFCVSNKKTFEMFDMEFEVVYPTESRNVIATSWNAGPLLDRMINCVLQSKGGLKTVFDIYTRDMLYANWLEIDALVSLLVVRWSRQPEAVVVTDEDGKKHLRLERVSLAEESIEHRGVPNANCTRRVFDDYNDVNSVDMTFVSTDRYVDTFLVISGWCNTCEFCLCTRLYRIHTDDVKDSHLVWNRLETGALGVLKRASYLRVAFEGWKRLVGIGDEIVTPYLFEFDPNFTVLEDSNGFRNMKEFLETIISAKSFKFRLYTNMNNKVESSLTGIRTGPVHRNLDSWQLKWNLSSVTNDEIVYETLGYDSSAGFFSNAIRNCNRRDYFQRFDLSPIRSTNIDHLIACVDWVDQSDNIMSITAYGDKPNDTSSSFPMRLFSSWQLELAMTAGWRWNNHHAVDIGSISPFLVGWGLPAWRRTRSRPHYIKATGVQKSLIDVMLRGSWVKGLWKNRDEGVNRYGNF